jgi:menaquinol-cytochrome c reductase iron-sulfur subunit
MVSICTRIQCEFTANLQCFSVRLIIPNYNYADMNRRDFLARIVQFFSLVIAVLLSLPVIRFLSGSLAESSESGWYPIADVNNLTEEVTQVQFTRLVRDGWLSRTEQGYVWVRKKNDGTCLVFEPHCTHLGCAYAWAPETKLFQCPCHGGKFDKDGNRVAGPPPRPLDRYEAKIENNTLKIAGVKKV